MDTATTDTPAVEEASQPSVLVQRLAQPEQLQPNPWAPADVVHEFISWALLTPPDAKLARADFDHAIDSIKPRPSELQIANLRMRLARSGKGRDAVTLIECDYPASDGEQIGMPAGQVHVRYGAVPVAAGVKLLLDEKRSPEAEIERRKVAFREAYIAQNQAAVAQAVAAAEAEAKAMRLRQRLNAWNERHRIERALERAAYAMRDKPTATPADILRAVAGAFVASDAPDAELPPGDIDLLPRVRF